jgi:PAS domain S-box-containing protein
MNLIEHYLRAGAGGNRLHQQHCTVPASNSSHLILNSVGAQVLAEIAEDYLKLLGTLVAVYETDGTYALSIFASNWCRFLNEASRSLCGTSDDSEAIKSGKWLCRESCWNGASKISIETGQPVDVKCHGGIRVFAVPIRANAEVVGSINVGYGNPPKEPDKLEAIAHKFGVAVDDLHRQAYSYEPRPAYVVDAAKKHLLTSAKLIGAIVEHHRMQKQLRESEEKYRVIYQTASTSIGIIEEDTTISLVNAEFEKLSGYSKEEVEWKKSWKEFVTADELQKMMGYHKARRIDPDSAPKNYECKFVDRYGNVKDVQITIGLIPGTKKSVVSLLDITEHKRMATALLQSEEKYRAIFECAGTAMAILEEDTTMSLVNAEFEQLTGFTKDMIEGKNTWLDNILENYRNKIFEYNSARKGGAHGTVPAQCEMKFVNRKGELKDVIVNVAMIPGTTKTVVSFMDVSLRRQAEEALQRSEERFRSLVENASDMIAILSGDGIINYVSPPVERVLGYKIEELIGQDVFGLFHPADLPIVRRTFAYCLQNPGVPVVKEARFRHKDGSWRFLEATGRNLLTNLSVSGIIVNCRDVTSRNRAERKVRGYQKQLRSVASELLFAEERERRRIANELHDLVCQNLAISGLKLGSLREKISDTEFKESLYEIQNYIEQTIDYTRSLVFELSPPTLYELGLEAALEWLTEQVQQRHGITVTFLDDGNLKPINHETRVTLFNAVRELMINIVKHAKARNAKILVHKKGNSVQVTVEDDGVGFNVAQTNLRTSSGKGGFGLFSIRERLNYLGGRMMVKSEPGRGTECTLIAPL